MLSEEITNENNTVSINDSINGATCLICFSNPPDSVIMDCGHGGICYDCAVEIWKKSNECYLCRNVLLNLLLFF